MGDENLNIASVQDVIDYLTSVMLCNSKSSVLINYKDKSCSYYEEMFKNPTEKERLKATELLVKFYDANNTNSNEISTVIIDDISTNYNNYFESGEDLIMDNTATNNDNISENTNINSSEINQILAYLSSVMYGKAQSSVLVNIKDESGSYYEEFFKTPSEDERLKSSEMLFKFYNALNTNSTPNLPVILHRNITD